MTTQMPIDIVITWVDGSDPKHAKKLAAFRPGADRNIPTAPSTRYANDGEIYFCIASILKYAPFVRKIWVISDDQSPRNLEAFTDAGLCSEDFIEVVDHKVVFREYEQYLPTFNSRAIEAVLWRIPGLAEHFVSFNDDFFVNAPISSADWFDDGKPIFGGRWELQAGEKLYAKWTEMRSRIQGKKYTPLRTNKLAQGLGAFAAGLKFWCLVQTHVPRPMRKSVQSAFYADNGDALHKQLAHRFRHHSQYSCTSLSNHLEMHDHGVRPQRTDLEAYLSTGKPRRYFLKNLDLIASDGRKFGCVQSLDRYSSDDRHRIIDTLIEKFGSHLPDAVCSELRNE